VKPYPSIEKQDKEMGSCISGSLINVVDLVMGQDGVLWVLDIGMTNTLSDHPKKDDEPKIIGFDAVTGKVNCQTRAPKTTHTHIIYRIVTLTRTIVRVRNAFG